MGDTQKGALTSMHQIRPSIKLEKTTSLITPRAGLILIEQMAKELDLNQLLDWHFSKLKKRDKGLSIPRQIMDLACMLVDGGTRIEDFKQLSSDQAWLKIREEDSMMAVRTLRDLLYRFDENAIKRFEQSHRQLVCRLAKKTQMSKYKTATLDVDATFIESHKKEAKYSYHKEPGFYPMMGFWAETGLTIEAEFREGNQSPASGALPFLIKMKEGLPEQINQIRLRSDAAWYQADVMDYCDQHKIKFAIGGKKTEAMMQAIEVIPIKQWELWTTDEEVLKQHPEQKEWLIAETVHSLEKSTTSYRVVVIRKPYPGLELFKGVHAYDLVVTNMDCDKRQLIRWYWERCTSENWHKELKYGFGLNQLPCSKYLPNAAYFHIAVLAFNLVQALKIIKLDQTWRYLTVKTLRYHLFHVAGVVVHHARRWILKLFHRFPHFDLFSKILYSPST
jgi:hypothetical protein